MNRLKTLFTVQYPYENPLDRQRAARLLWLLAVGFIIAVASAVAITVPDVLEAKMLTVTDILGIGVAPLVAIFGIVLVQRGHLNAASMLIVIILIPTSMGPIQRDGIDTPGLIGVVLPLAAAAFLLNRRGFVITAVVVLSSIFLITLGTEDSLDVLGEQRVYGALTVLGIVVVFMQILSGGDAAVVERLTHESQQMHRVTALMNRVDRSSTEAMLTSVLDTIRDDMGYTFAQFFLVDDRGNISHRLRSGLSHHDQGILTEVEMNALSAPAQAVSQNRVVQVSMTDPPNLRSHLLPSTFTGVIIPLQGQRRVLALLDVQLNDRAITPEELQVLLRLSDNIALTLMAIRPVQTLEAQLAEYEQTIAHLRGQLDQYREGSSVWDRYFESDPVTVGFDLNGEGFVPKRNLPDEIQRAIQSGDIYSDDHTIAIPIRLRDEILGALSFTVEEVTERKIELARNVTSRLAIALENKRLFEQSQAWANRERQASEIASLLIGATDVESVLSLAANSFNETLGAVRTQIHLQPEEAEV
jgi:hypothetical protein